MYPESPTSCESRTALYRSTGMIGFWNQKQDRQTKIQEQTNDEFLIFSASEETWLISEKKWRTHRQNAIDIIIYSPIKTIQ